MKTEAPLLFSQQLREDTRHDHDRAEKTAFIQGFLRGVVSRDNYVRMLRDLFEVYEAMEQAQLGLRDHPVVGPLVFPELFRTTALGSDLRSFAGPQWLDRLPASAAARRYRQRLESLASDEPNLLVGHLYTRYLGDLSGGRILARIAANSLQLTVSELRFYQFPQLEAIAPFKAFYRRRLDQVGTLPAEARQAILDEANFAFGLNIALFRELEGSAWPGFWRNCHAFARQAVTASRLFPTARPLRA